MHDFDITIIDTIARDEVARRELLWLRAKEKGYDEVLLALTEKDPELPARMHEVERGIDAEPGSFAHTRAYRRAWDACYAKHASRLCGQG